MIRSSDTAHNNALEPLFDTERFEWLAMRGDVETAARHLVFLLEQLDLHYACWGEQVFFRSAVPVTHPLNRHLCTRIAGAVTALFCRTDFSISEEGYVQLMPLHRWLALIFAVSSYGNGDHIIHTLNAAGGGVCNPLILNNTNLKLFCLSYYPESCISLQPDVLWQYDRRTVARLFLALIGGRAFPTQTSHSKREKLLAWLPERLSELDSLDSLPTALLHDVYMHCSYADLLEKHQIKRNLNELIRRSLLAEGFTDIAVNDTQKQVALEDSDVQKSQKKPVILVILEWFTCQHSIYRTHSRALASLHEYFTVHAIGLNTAVDEVSKQVFDVFHEVKAGTALQQSYTLAKELTPNMLLYVGIGMFPFTIYLSNLRLAPIQLVGLGHGASTFCDQIDGFVIEEDLAGEESCFSEMLIKVPADAMPFVPPVGILRTPVTRIPFLKRQQKHANALLPVRVAVCASIMKINPGFLNTLAEIKRRSRVVVQFCFYMGFAQGLALDYLVETIHTVLPDAEVNGHMSVQQYQQALNSCELFVSPFPYGNMNGVVDAVRQWLPGVCLTGPEVHSYIDGGLFRRLGLPDELVAQDTEHYIRAAVKLAENTVWREFLQRQLQENNPEQVLFSGRPQQFALTVANLLIRKEPNRPIYHLASIAKEV